MSSYDVVVVGSANQDLVLSVKAIPRPGETVLARGRATHAGGKGLNQAVAAARAGATTAFIGAVGNDEPGSMLRGVLAEASIDTSRLQRSEHPTGVAIISVDARAENSIIVASGANGELVVDDADLAVVRAAKVLVLQLEVPIAAVQAAASAAREVGVTVILNAAPAQSLPADLLSLVDVLVVNEHEAVTLGADQGAAPDQRGSAGFEEFLRPLLELVPTVVVTLGHDGALVGERDREPTRQPAPSARAVDTTGAGDTFTGALAASLARGDQLTDAVWFASCAASLAVQVEGAVPSIPTLAAIAERQRTMSRRDGWPDPTAARVIDLPTPVPLDDGADLSVLDEAKIIAAPLDRTDWAAWRKRLATWRSSARDRFDYDGSRYDDPANQWAARAWNVAIVWLWDEAIYDWETHRFDVERLIDTYASFGGLDGVVLWHAYPVIGIDDRNQFDFYRDVPRLTELVRDLQGHGIRVFLDYNPWDTGTRRPAGSDPDEVAALVRDSGADGVFLDTLKEGGATLRDTLLGLDPAPALEGESRVPTARIGDHLLSWAQWMADSEVPGVLRARWYEQRHMLHHTRRWNTDHSDELQSAWLNGVGVLIWDVVFGSYVGWNERDKSIMRAMRRTYEVLGDLVISGTWTPLPDELAIEATEAGVFGASYKQNGVTFWPLINRRDDRFSGPAVADAAPGRWFDLIAGTEIGTPDIAVPAHGIGGLLHVAAGADEPAGLHDLLALAAGDPLVADTRVRQLRSRTTERERAPGTPSAGAVMVDGGTHRLDYRARVRETGLRYSPAYSPGTWKPLPPHLHGERNGTLGHTSQGVAVDPAEVTNADFEAFLAESGYRPKITDRFLAHWTDGRPAPGTEGEPVIYIDLDDARAYAEWRGARLPIEPEWQIAAGDPAFRRLEPLVWNWTEPEYRDGRTRWTLLKGGSWYVAEGSDWYFDGGLRDAAWLARLVLPGGGLARSATVGFRCAVDLETSDEVPGGLGGWSEYSGA